MGYSRAGFEVVGVDIKPQKNYPFEFVQSNALEYLAEHGHEYDVIHASPPCQAFSQAVKKKHRTDYPNLIPWVRNLMPLRKHWVIENVPTAREYMGECITLCGSSFGLPVRRHRLFRVNAPVTAPDCRHNDFPPKYPPAWNRKNLLRVISISGGYQGTGVSFEEKKAAMGIDWDVTLKELSEAIPPAYTEYIGKALLRSLNAHT